jgi:hydroxymethylpyrimidine pyrophosphatase-like HAD family hydrolase
MRYCALACDYDGTLAWDGVVSEQTLEALQRLKASGWRLLLVTGREIDDLLAHFSQPILFDRIVAENGAVLYRPEAKEQRLLSRSPPGKLIDALREEGIQPLSVGRVIVATRVPQEHAVIKIIRQLGLELQVIFNKSAVMVLPTGVNKATGLAAALKELKLRPERVVGIGDAENDHALIDICGFAATVANALPALREHADWVAPSANGAGVAELIEKLLQESSTRGTGERGAQTPQQKMTRAGAR